MNKAFRLFFWGYLFIFFRLYIGIDILAAPIGYYFIYSGARLIVKRFPVARKVEIISFIGMLFSVPGVFVNLSVVTSGGWTLYAEALFVLKVIAVYYLFTTWKSMAQGIGHSQLRSRVQLAYFWYMGSHFIMLLMSALSLNFGDSTFSTLYIVISFAVITMDVMLLFLIESLRRNDWQTPAEKSSLEM